MAIDKIGERRAIYLGFTRLGKSGKWRKDSDGGDLTYSDWDITGPYEPLFESLGTAQCIFYTMYNGRQKEDFKWQPKPCFSERLIHDIFFRRADKKYLIKRVDVICQKEKKT